LANFVINSLIQLFANVTKYGWFDTLPRDGENVFIFREIIEDVSKFIQSSTDKCIIGVRLLNDVVVKINNMDEIGMNRSLTKHRKILSSFRDTQLLEIFTMTCNLIKQANQNIKQIILNSQSGNNNESNLLQYLLQLCSDCLQFDFIGTTSNNDDTADDLSTIQIPMTWRSSNY
jgi:exportin-7